VTSPFRGPIWRNTQCKAPHRRTPLSFGIHASETHHCPLRACQKRESSRRRREIAESVAPFCEYTIQGSPRPHPTLLLTSNTNEVGVYGHGVHNYSSYLGGSGGGHNLFGPILRIRNARRSAAASRSAFVFMHEVGVCGHGGHI